ncbi:MAG: DUF4038 domain-containing protein [Verrucomicrobiota bacterium]|nr:DUF4038 domain-containing protein [Verrucomicrobiota bacterium]
MNPPSSTHSVTGSQWETVLQAVIPSPRPYLDIAVTVTYTHLDTGDTHSAPAAWDDENRWILRNAFPRHGLWSWRTTASNSADTGLHNRTGTVSVSPYTGSNPLFRHGFIQSSADGRYLAHADGTPFLWIGDTVWRATNAATPAQWSAYVKNREALGYSVIQIAPICAWDNTSHANLEGELPFHDQDYSRLNPDYWRHLDRLIAEANEHGLVVMLTGLPGWQINLDTPEQTPNRQAFVRQLVGRFHGRHVIYSPSADQYHNNSHRVLGRELRAVTSRQPITQHPGTHGDPARPHVPICSDYYYGDDYLSFVMYQSGHNEGDVNKVADQARLWALSLYQRPAARRLPVINGEAYYEGDPRITERPLPYTGTAAHVRLCAYYSVLSGSTSGFTNGILGLWDWNFPRFRNAVPFERAMGKPSATHLGHLGSLLRRMPWWTLVPSPDCVHGQPSERPRQIVFARNPAGTAGIAYLPDNASVTIDLTGMTGPLATTWFNPVSAATTAYSEIPAPFGLHTFTPPASQPGQPDWVLILSTQDNRGL